jgi:nicotinamidase-related amidase
LRARGISRLYLCGVSTNGVVHTGAREGHDRDYECIVLEDCCAGATKDEHESALKCVARFAAIRDSAAEAFA